MSGMQNVGAPGVDPGVQQAAQIAAQIALQHLQQHGASSSSSSSHRGDKPRLPAPPAFDGRTAGGVDVWLRELRKQFSWYGSSMQAEADRIRFGSAHLSGVALDWWESIEGKQPVSWSAFEEALRTRFQPANSADAARQQLDKLRHLPRQQVHEYTAEFRRLLMALPKMEEGDRVYRYVSGLQSRLSGLVKLQAPSTLADAISLAARVDGLSGGETPAAAGGSAPQGVASALGGTMPLVPAFTGEQPMDVNNMEAPVSASQFATLLQSLVAAQVEQREQINAMLSGRRGFSSSSSRVPHATNEQIQERRERGACFACGKEGHRKADCPASNRK